MRIKSRFRVPYLAVCGALAAMASGCADPSKPLVFTNLATVNTPHECETPDPAWVNPPDGDEKRSETARRERKNKNSFMSMRADRSVCRAGIRATKKEANSNG